MLKALLIDHELDSIRNLTNQLHTYYPNINICGECSCLDDAYKLVSTFAPELIFIEAAISKPARSNFISEYFYNNYEIIVTSSVTDHAVRAVQNQVCGYLLKPIEENALCLAMATVFKRAAQRESRKRDNFLINRIVNTSSSSETIGIPTIEGFEFVLIKDIIRCEGLQKCTRVITKSNCNAISSYNIGEFRKLLEPFGFFAPHKSHLINLKYIRKYRKEGTIIMLDNSHVPVARRRRNDFLDRLLHI